MKAKDILKKIFYGGSAVYTAGSLFILLLSLLLPSGSSAKILSPLPFIFFALYSFIISVGSAIYSSEVFSSPVSRLIHALCYNLGFFGFAMLCGVKFAYAVIFTAIFAIAYVTVTVLAGVFAKASAKTKNISRVRSSAPASKSSKVKKGGEKAENTYTNRFS